MPLPRHSVVLPSVQLPPAADCSGMTELRVHGAWGTKPEALLADLAPVHVWGDRIAGFYRTSDHRASPGDDDVDRHVECYSWGGRTARSQTRVLWLALLPFLLGNLAGWMCSTRTRRSRGRFAFHRASAGLGALALTVNAVLVAVMITADILGYQTVRAGLAGHQWWLAPLGWSSVSGYPARQILLGVAVPVLFVLALTVLVWRSYCRCSPRPSISWLGAQPSVDARIYSVDGKLVARIPLAKDRVNTWDARSLDSGLYLVQVQSGGKCFSKKFLLQK